MRLIDADALKEIIFGNSYILSNSTNSMNFGMFCDGIEQAIDETPTIDAVPVVRCKDCKWFGKTGCAIDIQDETDAPGDDDYCSFSEREDDE